MKRDYPYYLGDFVSVIKCRFSLFPCVDFTTNTNTTSATCVSDPSLTGYAPFGGNSPHAMPAGG